MDARTREILGAVISEFIETGEPVSSGHLYKKYRFDVKPATIRHELHILDDEAYLLQPHTSAGRVPTNKGYQLFVEQILLDSLEETARQQVARVQALRKALTRGHLDVLVEDITRRMKVIGVGYTAQLGLQKKGLQILVDDLIKKDEIHDASEVAQIVKDFECIDDKIEDLMSFLPEDRPSVFIGRSPVTKSPHLSVIADSFKLNGEPTVLAMIGSKRMDYENNINFFVTLKNSIV